MKYSNNLYIPRLNFQTFVILAASERVDDDNESMAKSEGRLLEDSLGGRFARRRNSTHVNVLITFAP